ncbi:MAG: hypothetical protein H7067_16390 [Burkholderiales bacterium]|nr:hypothetical protein [Opitutaceae bacterium]
MKRPILVLICGLLFAFVLDRVGAIFCKNVTDASGFRLFALYGDAISPELLIAGNSRAMQSFDAELMTAESGQKVFNIGFNGAPPDLVCAFVKDAVDRHSSVRTVVIEASCFWPINPGADVKPLALYSDRIDQYLRETNVTAYRFVKLSKLYAFNSELFHRAFFFRKHSDQRLHATGVITPEIIAARSDEQFFPASATASHIELLDDLQSYLNGRKVRLILVIAPYHPSTAPRFSDYDSLLSSVSSPDRRLIDCSQVLREDKYFADRLHLNIDGAREFTRILQPLVFE